MLGNLLGDVKTTVRLVLGELEAVEQLAAVSGGQLGAEPRSVHLMQPGQLNQPNVGLCQQNLIQSAVCCKNTGGIDFSPSFLVEPDAYLYNKLNVVENHRTYSTVPIL